MQGFYIMRIAVKGRPKIISLAETIGHEMAHVQQMVRGDLQILGTRECTTRGFPEIRTLEGRCGAT
jgi:hypothetical protein